MWIQRRYFPYVKRQPFLLDFHFTLLTVTSTKHTRWGLSDLIKVTRLFQSLGSHVTTHLRSGRLSVRPVTLRSKRNRSVDIPVLGTSGITGCFGKKVQTPCLICFKNISYGWHWGRDGYEGTETMNIEKLHKSLLSLICLTRLDSFRDLPHSPRVHGNPEGRRVSSVVESIQSGSCP